MRRRAARLIFACCPALLCLQAVVSNPMRNILWILSRTPQMNQTLYDDVVGRLGAEGFNTAKLELTPQPAE